MVASGFTLIFGLMRVVNMAHGTLYLLGGYLALNFQQKLFADDGGGLNLSLSAGGGGGGGEYNIIGWVVPLAMAVISSASSASRSSSCSCAGTRARTCARR